MNRSPWTPFLTVALVVSSLSACKEEPIEPQQETFRFAFRTTSDGAALPGAGIIIDGQHIGQTDANGVLRVEILGIDGQTRTLAIQPPSGYRHPEEVPRLTLRSFVPVAGQGAEERQIQVDCPPAQRWAAVIINANGNRDLPVKFNGVEVATTDEAGFAHYALALEPDEQFRLQLDTTSNDNLTPANPYSPTFQMEDRDMIFSFNADLERPRARPVRSGFVRRPGPSLPRRF